MAQMSTFPLEEQLKTFGFAVQENVFSEDECARIEDRLELLEAKQEERGTQFKVDGQKILYALHLLDPGFLDYLNHPRILPNIRGALGSGEQIILNSLSASKSVPIEKSPESLVPHIDSRMPSAAVRHSVSVNFMLCVNDFRADNGGLVVWPLSHRTGSRPPQLDWHEIPGATVCEAPRGSVIYWLGQTWHMVGENVTGANRWGVIGHYTYWFIKPTFDYTGCGPELFDKMSQEQKVLCGFASMPPKDPTKRVFTVTDPSKLSDDYDAAVGVEADTDFVPYSTRMGLDSAD